MHRRLFTLIAAAVLCLAAPVELRVLDDAYPRAYFFHFPELLARNPKITYEQWDASMSRLMGIESKALDEEMPEMSARNIDFFLIYLSIDCPPPGAYNWGTYEARNFPTKGGGRPSSRSPAGDRLPCDRAGAD